MICSQKHIIHSCVWCTSQNTMIVIQYICVFLYVCQMSKFTYSKVIGRPKQSLSVDLPKCSSDDWICFEGKVIDNSSVMAYFSRYIYILWSYYYQDVKNINVNETNSMTIEIQNEEGPTDYDYYNELEQGILNDDSSNKVKRSLELVEEQPPEGTYRPPPNDDDTRTVRSLPDIPSTPSMPSMPSLPSLPSSSTPQPPTMPSVPSIPQPPTMPSMPSIPQPTTMPSSGPNTEATKYEVTTQSPEMEQLETTTEDYGNIGEPNCDYDPLSFVLKCGLNLITSIFGLSDTCCKPII
ncbi:uncharacterized protein LOC107883080 [Acyrthosiphon pisum]|uniref:Uncharacterized protein n=1 Tax=Acyrthosiphon pisum TaxID=7029 RepID=A0A8R2D3F4_ACYPI|nr:uncharacterized protein LOC107883080 [Acyrthosiphon pisum]|eukprot:XP_016657968.1 PREDICTED: IgA FC receptor [Acyrthosiphon pisum]